MKNFGRSEDITQLFLNWALDGGVLSASRPVRFTVGERYPCTHWIGGWVSLREGSNAVEKRKIPFLCWELNPGRPTCSTLPY
jgi:hypothetical protein